MMRKSQEHVTILGIKMINTQTDRVLRQVHTFITEKYKKRKSSFLITTPNPEIILRAQKDKRLKKIINESDIAVPDGVGIKVAYKVLLSGQDKINIIPGRKLFTRLIRLANKRGWKVYLLGDESGNAGEVVQRLRRSYKKIKLFESNGPVLSEEGSPVDEKNKKVENKIIGEMKKVNPDILFVGFGAPKQEKWLYRHRNKSVFKVGMVVGGTFNYVSGKRNLPPRFIENLGLEWLWRLITGSQKTKRVFNAIFVFPLKVLMERVSKS